MVCYNICPNCGQYMYERQCRAVCPRCGVFYDCEDLFPYDVVITAEGEHYVISADGAGGSISFEAQA
jgi:hypothetical protein